MKRKPISKKTRFEVFKRDGFRCQYCGRNSPDVVLHVDHINPVASGGDSSIMNLVTSCVDCNLGKGKTEISDASAIAKQKAQLDLMQERRDQMEMMLKWRKELSEHNDRVVDMVSENIGKILYKGRYIVNECGKNQIRKWLSKYQLSEIMSAIDKATQYIIFNKDGEVDGASCSTAFNKVERIAHWTRQYREKPWLETSNRAIAYVRKIHNPNWTRLNYWRRMIEELASAGASIEDLFRACRGDSWREVQSNLEEMSQEFFDAE